MVCRPLWSPAEAESNKYRERRNMQHDYPILEFDSTLEAMLEPRRIIKPIDIPEHAVACFFQDVITQLSQRHAARVIKHLKSEIGTHPVYELEVEGRLLAVFHPGVGAPLAAGMLEEVIALGCKKFIACGGAAGLYSRPCVRDIIRAGGGRRGGCTPSYSFSPRGGGGFPPPSGSAP